LTILDRQIWTRQSLSYVLDKQEPNRFARKLGEEVIYLILATFVSWWTESWNAFSVPIYSPIQSRLCSS